MSWNAGCRARTQEQLNSDRSIPFGLSRHVGRRPVDHVSRLGRCSVGCFLLLTFEHASRHSANTVNCARLIQIMLNFAGFARHGRTPPKNTIGRFRPTSVDIAPNWAAIAQDWPRSPKAIAVDSNFDRLQDLRHRVAMIIGPITSLDCELTPPDGRKCKSRLGAAGCARKL